MKKISLFLASVAMLAAFSSCNKDNKGDINLDDIVLDGFYVYGDATGEPSKVLPKFAMAAGHNEALKDGKTQEIKDAFNTPRPGMYEKYIWLEAGKDFALIENQGKDKVFYGAELKPVDGLSDNPNVTGVLQGKLIIGENAPKMQVSETGMYHIVLDKNLVTEEDYGVLEFAQIIVQRAKWGIRGHNNGWGYTPADEEKVNADGTITYTWNEVEFKAGVEFKFSSCEGWKISLDLDGKVKAETSFGYKDGKLTLTSDNIKVEKKGVYSISLTYTPKSGDLGNSFEFSTKYIRDVELLYPEELYLTGTDFGNWTWGSEGVVSMIPVHSEEGHFWAVRKLTANHGFKFNPVNIKDNWDNAFGSMTNNVGCTTDEEGNCIVEEDGLYMIEVSYPDDQINIHKAELFGCDEPFANLTWAAIDAAKYTINSDGTASYTLKANGAHLRSFVKSAFDPEVKNWWHREFTLADDGKIAYRGTGGDSGNTTGVVAGKTVTLDFNAGTGTIK